MQLTAQSIRETIEAEGWTIKEASENWEVRYDWLRRVCTNGTYWTRRNNQSLLKISGFYGVTPEVLVDPLLFSFAVATSKSKISPPILHRIAYVLRHYNGKPKPDYLLAALKILDTYCHELQGGNEPDRNVIRMYVDLRFHGPTPDELRAAATAFVQVLAHDLEIDLDDLEVAEYVDFLMAPLYSSN